ncbi:MAG TPA: O-antigen ligase family protein [Fibrobacteria bacterium]|nr:O-antigen ligase family protein [Fibrobacteria bacterium]
MISLRRPWSRFAPLAPVILLSAVLGGGLVIAFDMGSKWIALTTMAYLAAAFGVVFKDKRLFAVCLAAACVPIGFQYNLWTHGGKFTFLNHFGGALAEPVIYLVDIPIALLALIWVADLRLGVVTLPRWSRMDTLLVSLIGAFLFSLYNTEEYFLFAFEVLRYLKYLAFYWMLRTYLVRPDFYWGILAVNIALLSIQGLVSLMQYFFLFQFPIPVGGVSGTDFDVVDNEIIQRVTGILGHSNTFAAYLTVGCSICLIVLFARVRTLYKLAVLPMLLAGLISMVFTFSRNGWMVLAFETIGLSYWALRTKRLQAGHILFIGGACAGLFGLLLVTGVFDTMLTRIFRTNSGAFDSRGDLLQVALEMIQAQPLIGIGLNSFEENMIHFDPNHITHIIRQPVHNGFLLVAAETGIPALLILLAVLAGYVRMSWAILRKDNELQFAVGLTGLVTFAGLGIANLFDVTLRKESIAGTIVVVAAMVAGLFDLDLRGKPSGEGRAAGSAGSP